MSEDNETKIESKEEKTDNVALQARDIKWRAQHQALSLDHENLKIKFESDIKSLRDRADDISKKNEILSKKALDSELKARAIEAGLKDSLFIKLIDSSKMSISEDGEISGVEEAISGLKSLKPELFGSEKKTSSSSGAEMPEKKKEELADVMKMSSEEYDKFKRNMRL